MSHSPAKLHKLTKLERFTEGCRAGCAHPSPSCSLPAFRFSRMACMSLSLSSRYCTGHTRRQNSGVLSYSTGYYDRPTPAAHLQWWARRWGPAVPLSCFCSPQAALCRFKAQEAQLDRRIKHSQENLTNPSCGQVGLPDSRTRQMQLSRPERKHCFAQALHAEQTHMASTQMPQAMPPSSRGIISEHCSVLA